MIESGWVKQTWQSELVLTTEAQRWLDACLKRRPDDVPVWRGWLNWGIATKQLNVVRQALKHLPAEDVTVARGASAQSLACRHAG